MKPLFDLPFPKVKLSLVPGFRYRGGKYKLRRFIARWCPLSGSTFCEPFAGRGNVLLLMKQIAKYDRWVLNDQRTIPFFQSILGYDGTPFEWPTEEEYRAREESGDNSWRFMEPIIFWDGSTSLKHNGAKSTFKINSSHGRETSPKRYRRTILRAQRTLRDVELPSQCALKEIAEHADDPDAFLYIDPPYLGADVNAYDDSMLDRNKFIKLLKSCRCRWLLSEYPCEDLNNAFGPPVGRIRKVKVLAGTPDRIKELTGKQRTVTECLWANFDARPQVMDFGYNVQPLYTSRRILGDELVSFKKWLKLVPSHWSRQQAKDEYEKLCYHPEYYYDGLYVGKCGSFGR